MKPPFLDSPIQDAVCGLAAALPKPGADGCYACIHCHRRASRFGCIWIISKDLPEIVGPFCGDACSKAHAATPPPSAKPQEPA